MSERLTDTESFWNNFQEEFNQWNNVLKNRQTTTSTTTTSTTTKSTMTTLTTIASIKNTSLDQLSHDHTAHDYDIGQMFIPKCSFRNLANRLQISKEMEFCLLKNCSFCDRCEEICEIHMMKPCKNTWSSLIETCCDMCNIQCETECPILLYVLAPIFSTLATVRIFIMNIINAFRT